MVLKMADIGHLMAAEDVHMKWVEGLTEEFFAQGDDEKRQGLPVSFLMDRDKPGVSSSQVGFFDFVVLPLFRAWVAVFPKSQPMLTLIEDCRGRWKVIEAEKEKVKLEKSRRRSQAEDGDDEDDIAPER